jgi:hypothetical protein
MNQKTARKYELIAAIAAPVGADLPRVFAELAEIDFQTAFEMWEFTLARGADIVEMGLDLFQNISETKTRQLFCESLPLQRLVYSSPCAGGSKCITFLGNLILTNKLDPASECLSRLRANTHLNFDEAMRAVTDAAFAAYCQKNNVRAPVFNRKQKDLLLSFIGKVKGPNRALLLQRMKEL